MIVLLPFALFHESTNEYHHHHQDQYSGKKIAKVPDRFWQVIEVYSLQRSSALGLPESLLMKDIPFLI